jgi:acyl-coenzyme A synthetase/AMP-(fatty) acid ligase
MATFDSATKIWEGPKVNHPFDLHTSLGGEILKKLAETPERVLHICHDEEISMTCEATRIASIRVAQNLTKLGVTKGDVVGFICTNSIKLPELIYGCLLIGAPINPLDIGFKKDDIKHMFEQTIPKLVFCDSAVYETVQLSLDEIGSSATIITLREQITGVHYVDSLLTETGNEAFFE